MIRSIYCVALYLGTISSLALAQELPTQLTIASWNIVWLGDGVNDCVLRGNHKNNATDCHHKHIRDQQDYQRLSHYAAMLNADVVALQEVENTAAIRRVFAESAWQVFISSRRTAAKWAQRTAVVVRSGIKVKRHEDYAALDTSSGHLRYGIDLTIMPAGGMPFRMLAIHLKAGCPHNTSNNKRACKSLMRQRHPLEAWIDARAESGIAFIVAGDWNRQISASGDKFWQQLDDAEPQALRLRLTAKGKSLCRGGPRSFVDHIVLGGAAVDWSQQFRELIYSEDKTMRNKLSDHCPIAVELTAQ